jgi:hypothetical protein
MSKEMRKLIDDFKTFNNKKINESEDKKSTLDVWKDLMDKYDLKFFKEFQTKTKSDLEQMREDWKAMRRYALGKLNQDLNNQGKSGQLLNIDVSDEELYPYIDDKSKQFLFLKYSRILDFSDGYRPKDFLLIKNGL